MKTKLYATSSMVYAISDYTYALDHSIHCNSSCCGHCPGAAIQQFTLEITTRVGGKYILTALQMLSLHFSH